MTQAVMPSPEVSREPRRSRPSLPGPTGWQPAHEDHSPEAVAWRAAHALERANEAHEELTALRGSVDKLNATMATVNTTFRTLLRGVWAVALPLIIMVLGGGLTLFWRWLSTAPK